MRQTHFLTPTSNQRLAQMQHEAAIRFWCWTFAIGLGVVNLGLYAARSFS